MRRTAFINVNFKSRPNLIQDIIFDLLKHNQEKFIYVEQIFLGNKTYRDNSFTKYIDNERKKDGVIKTLRLHDPFANFVFLKNVLTNGLIDVSEDLKSVISLSEEDFSIKLDNLSNTTLIKNLRRFLNYLDLFCISCKK